MTRVLVIALLAAASAARAQTVDPAQVDSMIRKTVSDKQIVGLSVGVMQNGKVILAKGYGVSDIATRQPVTPNTMFGIGSVTKQFTCTALLMLAEEKKLSLADHVAKYFPNLTRANDITLLDLGGHLSGYRDYYPLDFVDQEMAKPATPDQIIDEYATRPLDFSPRSHYSYSNTGFLILGRIVEKVSGEPFGRFITERIVTPLKLARTAYEPATTGSDMAHGYTSFGLADPVPAQPEAPSWAGMAGAIWSTPSDLLRWDRSLLDHELISPSSVATITTPQRLSDGRTSGYGCGEGVNDRGQSVVLSHGGAVSGFVAQNTVIPATRSAVVMLSNTDFSPVGALNQQLVAKLLPPSGDIPSIAGASAIDAARKFLIDLEKGQVDRSTLGEDFSVFLSPAKVDAARTTLNALGPISGVTIAGTSERGGMAVSSVRFTVGSLNATGLMYRTPDGRIQEFLFARN
jgi:D-alanyl-D-alanine carboxypeptidase